ncbi:hypothetical protein [Acinetobacter pullicarnis]|uniref:hypothetical protein n=1 Tax=Acinetobacter pullicarnis TaxID=2576829 RepID=UPI00111F1789|nr:hypothetical protein [Acinetobacter pullicarnis]
MLKKLCLIVGLPAFVALTGCSQMAIDTISDATYMLTGVPGPKHNNAQTRNSQGAETDGQRRLRERRAAFQNKRTQWYGKSIDDLTVSWGSPWGVHQRTDGGKQYTWKYLQYMNNGANQTICVDNFITDKKGIITKWTSQGCWDHI